MSTHPALSVVIDIGLRSKNPRPSVGIESPAHVSLEGLNESLYPFGQLFMAIFLSKSENHQGRAAAWLFDGKPGPLDGTEPRHESEEPRFRAFLHVR